MLSVVVVVYRMRQQALRTLASLTPEYQLGVDASHYEVIVVENDSDSMLAESEVEGFGPNFQYLARHETAPTPVNAVNDGVALSTGQNVGVVVDGARMASPGLVGHTLAAARLAEAVVVVVPGYHLGAQLQQRAVEAGYGEEAEDALLAEIGWPGDGYRLFDISVLSGTSKTGFFRPFAESNFLSVPRWIWDDVGGMDCAFDAVGGGFANLDLYRRIIDHDAVAPVMLFGEGTFHQFHGGVTTGGTVEAEREAIIEASRAQYAELRGEPFEPPRKRFLYFGAMPPNAVPFLYYSAGHLIPDRIRSEFE